MIDINYQHHIPTEIRPCLTQLERKWFRDKPVYLVSFDYDNCPYNRMCNTIREVKRFALNMVKMKRKDDITMLKVERMQMDSS